MEKARGVGSKDPFLVAQQQCKTERGCHMCVFGQSFSEQVHRTMELEDSTHVAGARPHPGGPGGGQRPGHWSGHYLQPPGIQVSRKLAWKLRWQPPALRPTSSGPAPQSWYVTGNPAIVSPFDQEQVSSSLFASDLFVARKSASMSDWQQKNLEHPAKGHCLARLSSLPPCSPPAFASLSLP